MYAMYAMHPLPSESEDLESNRSYESDENLGPGKAMLPHVCFARHVGQLEVPFFDNSFVLYNLYSGFVPQAA